jgi:Domain of unknown function (DUF4123)/Inner membrane component of T3SS, cytoplasmic domain
MKFLLEIVAGPRAGSKYPLNDVALIVGRNPSASVPFPEDNFLSGAHCSFQVASDGVVLKDLNSTNGTFLNGLRITQSNPRPGDLITAGSVTMRILIEQERRPIPPPQPATAKRTAVALNQFATLPAPLYCLLDAACDKTIPSLLALANEQKQCLYDGQSATDLANWAPYLVKLPVDSPFTKAMLDLGWGKGWASYFTSTAPFEEIRHHFRKFLMIQMQGGEEVYFRFYDPRVLREFLPTSTPEEASIFCGPVQQWLIEAEEPETMLILQLNQGALTTTQVNLSSTTDLGAFPKSPE